MLARPKPFLRLRPFCGVIRARPAVFSIPPHKAFADALVAGLIKQFGHDKMAFAHAIILVPNNRAGVAIQDAFVRQCETGLLLPRLVPIGDADLNESVGLALDPIDVEPIQPAIDPLHRQMILARKLQQVMSVEQKTRLDGAQAMRLAADLGRVIDVLLVERKSVSDLRNFDQEQLSEYWAESLKTLSIILDDWPAELRRLGRVDLAERRNIQLSRVAEKWRSNPPRGFVVAAGISTAAPAIADLVKQVARMERGQVVLAGLDFDMSDAAWESLMGNEFSPAIETHPQFHLHLLLDRIGVARSEVDEWQGGELIKSRVVRGETVSRAMAPADFTRDWEGLSVALSGVDALEVATPAEEAQSIALALREAIETPGRTAALVTPDRALAQRVSAHLKRWGIDADDSAGRPLANTQVGTFLIALANAVAEHFAPVPLLALLKHPLVNGGGDRRVWLDGARKLDLALRGPRPAAHVAGIDAYLTHGDERTSVMRSNAEQWWKTARELLLPLEAAVKGEPTFASLVASLSVGANQLCGEALWLGQEGHAAAELIASLVDLAEDGPSWVGLEAFPHLLRDLLGGIAIRPARGGHPRLYIWGLLEAKLQSADLIVLAGLNEGVWPQLASPDPWLAPRVRRALGLPSLERRIGLSAHDLVCALGAQHVLLTRAKRDAQSPTIASRFWMRLETLANGFTPPMIRYDLIAQALDFSVDKRAEPPRPNPPVAERPRTISVTQVDGLKADPYAFYARKMLKLSALDAPGEEPDARWRGTFLHDVLGKWGEDDRFAEGKLLPRLRAAFDTSGLHPVVRVMWQPRFEEASSFFEARVTAQRAEGREPIVAEIAGAIDVAGVTLTGRADRIDQLPDGKIAIVDYKTGAAPSDKQVKDGYALQLALIGHLADTGKFSGVQGQSSVFEYWSQSRGSGKSYGRVTSPTAGGGKNKSDPNTFVGDVFFQFEQAVEHWLTGHAPFTAKRRPDLAYTEFDHLMRYDEWQGRDG
jgi:ATP-dependent helicase/nuclease subunit B